MVYFSRRELNQIKDMVSIRFDTASRTILDKVEKELDRPRRTSLSNCEAVSPHDDKFFRPDDNFLQINYKEVP